LTALILVPLTAAGPAGASLWYVATNGSAPNDGTKWSTAYTNVQAALDAAVAGATICLAGQTFPLTTQLTWSGKTNVAIRGAYSATNDADLPGPCDPRRWPTAIVRASGASCRILQHGSGVQDKGFWGGDRGAIGTLPFGMRVAFTAALARVECRRGSRAVQAPALNDGD
jgi:hypothetical protein